MKDGWRLLPFSDAIQDNSGGNEKTPQSQFLPVGRFPVIDQGKEIVAGYVNEESRLCRVPLPVVVFGDHTRCFKFVDFPFCMGADGVKVLSPKVDADVKYLYYYLRQLRLTEGGYDRHFKYLKRTEVLLPPLPEQRRIAEVLDRAEALRAKRRAALAHLDTLTQSIFLSLFGDPVTNPNGFLTARLESLVTRPFQNGAYFPAEAYCANGGVEMVHMSDAFEGVVARGALKRVSCTSEAAAKYGLNSGDLLVARRSLNYEGSVKPCLVPESPDALIFESSLIRLTPDEKKVDVLYIYHYLSNPRVRERYVFPYVTHSTISGINQSNLSRVLVLVPPMELRREFTRRVSALEHLKSAHRTSLAKLDALFASLQHRAFRGEL